MLRYQHYSSSLSGQVFFYEAITTCPHSCQDHTDKQVQSSTNKFASANMFVSAMDQRQTGTCKDEVCLLFIFKRIDNTNYISE